ncbi:ABC transporter ATP-binding protein [Bacillus aquiflavi]|uniref:ABC transporter ATP-binding protein n=1 Tax=Bacillus aquiflavi TaxID=2672567 RepID=A0A6B3W569_9BACI|nr:ABC transporter ATP-binding protein [Bacillus aquiflavi]MBA4538265.1 ABC transporter ATP-binding protein [Bacillus aquiflavi]NEY82584.1 ABC transporter ATP-binding protein [Bacillus aquiflavi]UAC48158.1 ABC transporter ATP-binding protein [Bacillus aquiflavi]
MVTVLNRLQEPQQVLDEKFKTNKIEVQSIHFSYEKIKILNEINLTVKESEFLVFMGPSGCGKSTLLRLIAGLEQPDGGDIVVNGNSIQKIHPDCSVVFQDYSLFPWLTARDNIILALKQRNQNVNKKELEHIAEDYLSLVNLGHAVKKYPGQMSGGMKQRAAIARALSYGADLLLMDEPFGALDPVTRVQLQDLLLRISREQNRTIVFVTHDAEEAIYLADRIIMFLPGAGGAKTVNIEIPFSRKNMNRKQLFASKEFIHFREHLLNMMNKEILNNLANQTVLQDGAGI